ncbi:formin-like protein 5 [Calypte anna]|uniref:formin-like protein 5 n=1 Tax=Calypte anna TaxID=9244 RepID=UPI0011C3F143|nr:formin-like protein 5 [Calypte anna]
MILKEGNLSPAACPEPRRGTRVGSEPVRQHVRESRLSAPVPRSHTQPESRLTLRCHPTTSSSSDASRRPAPLRPSCRPGTHPPPARLKGRRALPRRCASPKPRFQSKGPGLWPPVPLAPPRPRFPRAPLRPRRFPRRLRSPGSGAGDSPGIPPEEPNTLLRTPAGLAGKSRSGVPPPPQRSSVHSGLSPPCAILHTRWGGRLPPPSPRWRRPGE